MSTKLEWLFWYLCLIWWQGTPALSQAGIPTEALVKGPISRITEESSPEKGREEAASKGHVIYEGKSGHILSYDSKYYVYTMKPILQHVTKNMASDAPHTCFREVSFPSLSTSFLCVKGVDNSTFSWNVYEKLTETVNEKWWTVQTS